MPVLRRRRTAFLTVILGAAAVVTLLRNERPHKELLTLADFVKLPTFEDVGISPGIMLSKALSMGVIAGSFIGKMPQVMKVWRARSAEGISKISVWTEAVSMGVQFAYNMMRSTPLTTYAEIAILLPQLLLLALATAWADGCLGAYVWLACFCLCGGTAAMGFGVVSPKVTTVAYAANTLLGFVAVLPQVVINYRNKSTGQLSFLVTAMTFGGLGTRLFTTLMEVNDLPLQITMVVNWTLVSILMLQFLLYPDTGPAELTLGPAVKEAEVERSESMALALSALGSSRCLTEMVRQESVDSTIQFIRLTSSRSASHFAGPLSFYGDFSRSVTAPVISHSKPVLTELQPSGSWSRAQSQLSSEQDDAAYELP